MNAKGMQTTILTTLLAAAVDKDQSTGGCDIAAGLFGPAVSSLLREVTDRITRPIDMVLHCPKCGEQHIDASEPRSVTLNRVRDSHSAAWTNPPHRTHLCHSCGHRWRPADVATNGVAAVKTRGKDDDPIVTPKPRVPDWDAIKDKRMSELTPIQTADARELWLREQINDTGRSQHDFESHIVFLLRRLDEARGVK